MAQVTEQQTAVEWFSKEVSKLFFELENRKLTAERQAVTFMDLLEKASKMEKEQTIDAHTHGYNNGYCFLYGVAPIAGEEYYNQTYKTQVRHEKHSRLGSNDGNDV